MATSVQNSFRRRMNSMMAGQVANTMPCSRESGILQTGTIDGVNRPDTLPFGYACGWVDGASVTHGVEASSVARYLRRKPIGLLNANIDSSATSIGIKNNEWYPGDHFLNAGDYIIMGTEWMQVRSIGNGTLTIARNQQGSAATAHTADDEVYVVGGRTNFAGVAIKNIALPGDNNPVDTYNSMDIVSVGSQGDFVVVCDGAVSRGDSVSVNVGATAANYGKFSNQASAHSSRSYIGIQGAVFMTDSVQETKYGSGATGEHLAVMRLTSQPR